jgi:phosphatidyl-myo-inositol dimannoside synthase
VNVSAQFIAVGLGGIARVARLSILALQRHTDVEALSVQDNQSVNIGCVKTRPFHSRRLNFVCANALQILKKRAMLYDFAGTARAHPFWLRRKSPYAVWIHGTEVWGYPELRPDYIAAVRAAALVLANSKYTLNRAQETLGQLPNARICWLATEQDAKPGARSINCDGPPIVLFVGRSDNLFAKGQDILIEIWPKVVSAVPDARLVFVGGGTHLNVLQDLASRSRSAQNIDVLGFVPETQMEPVWQRATVFAMLSHVEGFGLVFAEAMRYGKPIIASTNDASQEINVDGVTGYNISKDKKADIVDRIIFLLKGRDKAAALGLAAFDRWNSSFRFSAFCQRLDQVTKEWLERT